MREDWRVAVLDSGLADTAAAPDARRVPLASCRFVDTGTEIVQASTQRDPIGHGTAIAAVIGGAGRRVDLIIAQVLDHHGATTAAALASAIMWSLEKDADLIHMSLGLRADRPVLALAVDRAVRAGCIVVASTPARGDGTFPARYPHVIRATGDARCERDEISVLDSAQADFGGCPRYMRTQHSSGSELACLGGASIGAAHLTRFLVERLTPGSDPAAVRSELRAQARHRGPEIRRS